MFQQTMNKLVYTYLMHMLEVNAYEEARSATIGSLIQHAITYKLLPAQECRELWNVAAVHGQLHQSVEDYMKGDSND